MLVVADSATPSPALTEKKNADGNPPSCQDQRKPGHDPEEDAIASVGLKVNLRVRDTNWSTNSATRTSPYPLSGRFSRLHLM